jgi:hypothetical protein
MAHSGRCLTSVGTAQKGRERSDALAYRNARIRSVVLQKSLQRAFWLERHAQHRTVIAAACQRHLLSVAELVPHVHRVLDERQTGFAFGEVLALVNHVLAQSQLLLDTDTDGIGRYRPP